MTVCQPPKIVPVLPPSRASPLPQGALDQAGNSGHATNQCGSWLACDDGMSATKNSACTTAIAGKPAPTGGLDQAGTSGHTANQCGSWLACDDGMSATKDSACTTAIAGKPAPTGGGSTRQGILDTPQTNVGAGLSGRRIAAIASAQTPPTLRHTLANQGCCSRGSPAGR